MVVWGLTSRGVGVPSGKMVLESRSKTLDPLQALPQTCRVSLHLSLTQTSVRSLLALSCCQPRTVPLQVLLKRREKREEASTASAPGATSKAPFRYRELSLLQKISWMALQGAGERRPVMATRLTRRSTLKVDSESKGDDGRHLLNLYCLPGVPKCLAYVLPQTLWGRYYYPHVQMEN